MVEGVYDPIIACYRTLLHHRCNQVRSVYDKSGGCSLPSFDVLSQGIIALRQTSGRIVAFGVLRAIHLQFQLLLIEVFQTILLDVEELQKTTLHLVLVTKCVIAKDEVEACHEIQMSSTMHKQILIGVDGIWELMHLEEGVTDVAHDLESNGLHIVRDLIKSHSVHLDGSSPLFLLEVDVTHIHTEAATEGVLLVLDNLGVDCQGFIVVVVCLMLYGQVEANCICQVDIQLVKQVLLLPKATQLSLFLAGLLGLL
mmetsp:Transcript_19843/g.46132  ORF Transcript_19843/g.46132 Transcript_19843/m.46132 type:complete len:255 (-) Transcript_19843:524-1288(-)